MLGGVAEADNIEAEAVLRDDVAAREQLVVCFVAEAFQLRNQQGRRADRQTCRQTGRQAGKQAGNKAGNKAGRQAGGHTHIVRWPNALQGRHLEGKHDDDSLASQMENMDRFFVLLLLLHTSARIVPSASPSSIFTRCGTFSSSSAGGRCAATKRRTS